MKTSFELDAEFRKDQGKGASRRLRSTGSAPAILYGGGKDPQTLSVNHRKLVLLLQNERFFSTILSIKIDGAEQQAILRDVQRHPATNQVVHLDLQRVVETEKLRMRIPLHFVGEATSVGVKTQGGIISHQANDIVVRSLPKDLPEFIEVDVSELALNQTIHLSDLKLPAGVELVDLAQGRDSAVVSVHAPRAEEPDAAVAAAAAAGAVAEGAAAVPAAGAAAAPAAEAGKDAKKEAPKKEAPKKDAPKKDAAKK